MHATKDKSNAQGNQWYPDPSHQSAFSIQVIDGGSCKAHSQSTDTSDEAAAPKGGVCNRTIAFTLAKQGGIASDTRPRKAHPSPACIPIKPTKQTRSTRSLGRRSPLPSRGGMKRVCTFVHWGWVYLPILGCVFQAAILCGRVLEGERRSMQATTAAVPIHQGASRRKLTIHANESWALTIVPGAVCFPPRCGCIRKKKWKSGGGGRGKKGPGRLCR